MAGAEQHGAALRHGDAGLFDSGFEVIGPFPDQETCEEHPAKWENSDYWPIELASPVESASLSLVA